MSGVHGSLGMTTSHCANTVGTTGTEVIKVGGGRKTSELFKVKTIENQMEST